MGISFLSLHATPTCDSGESNLALVGVLTISAPRARRTSTCGGRLSLTPCQACHAGPGSWAWPLAYLLHAHLLRHDDDAAVALHGRSQRQPDPWGQHGVRPAPGRGDKPRGPKERALHDLGEPLDCTLNAGMSQGLLGPLGWREMYFACEKDMDLGPDGSVLG